MAENPLLNIYQNKDGNYFTGARKDIIESLTTNRESKIIEIGCGDGSTGELALKNGKAGYYLGIEIVPEIAKKAQNVLSKVIVANVEEINLNELNANFDVLIASEVLEHLSNPWDTLKKLSLVLKKDGMLYVSSPNISSFKVIKNLLRGRFDYAESGVMDKTHLRWFTPSSYVEMVETSGFKVKKVSQLNKLSIKAKLFNLVTFGMFKHFTFTQIYIVAVKL